MKMKLLLRSGPGAGEEVSIPPMGLVVGRGEEADFRIADRGASRKHCRFLYHKGGVRVADLESKNGTLVNGLPVEKADLEVGDVVQVGAYAFQVLSEEVDPSATAVFLVPDEDHRETLSLPAGPGAKKAQTADRLVAAFHLAGIHGKELERRERFSKMLDILLAHTPAFRASLILFEGDPPKPVTAFVREAGGGSPERLSLGETMARKAYLNGEALLFQNLGVDPTWPEAAGSFTLFYSAVCAPLPSASGARGVIYMDTLGGEGELGEKDLQLAAVAGALAGASLEMEDRVRGKGGKAPSAREGSLFGMIGGSAPMRRIFDLIRKVARTDSTVLIYGESGTGKELVARAIHSNGPRRKGPYIPVNCGAIPQGLLESELFGFEKGAFTGAHRRMPGRFETASGGVLFLDEIAELTPESQVKILRALEEKSVSRLGSTRPTPVDVRLVAATNQDLEKAVADGRFRQDLYYRLNVIVVDLPPLRERPDDIPALVNHFLEYFRNELGHAVDRVDEEAMRLLCEYAWPGNVRELRNTVERALVLSSAPVLETRDISFLSAALPATGKEGDLLTLREMEARHISCVLERCGGNKTKAAAALGIERSTLYEKLKAYGIGKAD